MFAAPAPLFNPEFAHDVREGFSARRKTLPARWLYDDLGSALFEAITHLPEYGLTRADAALLREHSPEIVDAAGHPSLIVELGSGTGSKTRHVLEAASAHTRISYKPIDVSSAALRACALELSSLEAVNIEPIAASYFEGLGRALANRGQRRALILFLGSTIGNFSPSERVEFLRELHSRMQPGDSLLLGTDLVKPENILLPAYDDPLGVTAAFNRNLLVRMNRELGANFDLSRFHHEARYDVHHARIEMHLVANAQTSVTIEALSQDVAFKPGETIWTESSYKFTPERIRRTASESGWRSAAQWIESEWCFAETLLAH